jgi:hypothetical protein
MRIKNSRVSLHNFTDRVPLYPLSESWKQLPPWLRNTLRFVVAPLVMLCLGVLWWQMKSSGPMH